MPSPSRRRVARSKSPAKQMAQTAVPSNGEQCKKQGSSTEESDGTIEHIPGWTSNVDTNSEGYTSREESSGGNNDKQTAPRTRHGVTLDGLYRFRLASTPSIFESLTTPNLPGIINTSVLALTFLCSLPNFPPQYILFCALAWRITYNVILGTLLRFQSQGHSMTLWMESIRNFKSGSVLRRFVCTIVQGSHRNKHSDCEMLDDPSVPVAYPAWLFFRWIVNVVEANDVLAFTLTAIRFANLQGWWFLIDEGGNLRLRTLLASLGWNTEEIFVEHDEYIGPYGIAKGEGASFMPIPLALSCTLGGLIVLLSLYSKLMAHRTAGEYSWYWGDFFFRIEQQELTFTGVFELFPHPMYTVGYAWTYGCALLSRNYVVLVLALLSHLAQMGFLSLVETPHVEKMYSSSNDLRKASSAVLFGNSKDSNQSEDLGSPLTTHQDQIFVVKNFDMYRASDVSLVLMLVFLVAGVAMGSMPGGPLDSDQFFIGQAIFWRIVDTVVSGGVLTMQSKTGAWTRHFVEQGGTPETGFESWKRLCNMMRSLRHVCFLMCAVRLFDVEPKDSLSEFLWMLVEPTRLARELFALMLMFVSVWSFNNCYQVLGDFSWFFGDFFLEPPGGDEQLSYAGIYRFLNNPDVYLGHLWMYGVALMCGNVNVALVGVVSHALDIVFLQIVEKPHLEALYKHRVRRSSSALSKEIKRRAAKISKSEQARFFANWIRHPISTGALAPSSRQLALAMCQDTGMGPNSTVIELGPGTGPFTEVIFELVGGRGKYIGFELNEEFYHGLRSKFPARKDDFILESAERIITNLKKRGWGQADVVVSGLPWAIFPDSLQERILTQVSLCLKPGGSFTTFAYLQGLVLPAGRKFRKKLDKHFGSVEQSPVVWANIPPAIVYRCQTRTDKVVRKKNKSC